MKSDRRSLMLIGLLAALPLFLFLSFFLAFNAQNRERAIRSNAHSDAALLIARSDGLLREALGTSRSLAATAAIASTDLDQARVRVERFRRDNPNWVEVALDDNGRRARLFDFGRTSAAGPYLSPGEVRISLRRDGDCRCILISRGLATADSQARTLHVSLSHAPFFNLMRRGYGGYEVTALVDDRGLFVARSLDDAQRFGTPGSIYLQRAARSRARSAFYRNVTLEGISSYTAFARSEISGWSAHVAIKAQRIDNPAIAFWISIGAAVLLSLGLAALLSFVIRRQLDYTRSITRRIQEAQKLEALGQLTGGMAHDFNNLLTPIVGALDRLMHSDNLNEREKRFAKGAFQSAERAAALTSQLLAFSRRQKLAIAVVSVPDMLDDVCQLAGQSLDVRHELDCSSEPGTPPITSDKVQLELAILNLILNARDSMPAGGTVQVRAAPCVEGGRPGVAIAVTDSGFGMDAETVRRAKEPFFTTKPLGAGTGLGLAQVAEVVKQSAGRLDIESAPGSGTTVRLIFAAAAKQDTQTPLPTDQIVLPAKMKLLIVDDDADVRETIVQMVEGDGHRTESVSDGRTALAALSNGRHDMVLVDFSMPGLNGAEFIVQAREIRPGLPCLLITGYWDSDALAESGVTCPILRKPFTEQSLRSAMAEALGDR